MLKIILENNEETTTDLDRSKEIEIYIKFIDKEKFLVYCNKGPIESKKIKNIIMYPMMIKAPKNVMENLVL